MKDLQRYLSLRLCTGSRDSWPCIGMAKSLTILTGDYARDGASIAGGTALLIRNTRVVIRAAVSKRELCS